MSFSRRPTISHLPKWATLCSTLGIFWLGLQSLPANGFQQDVKPTPEQAAFFETKIRPILADNCYGCHGKSAQSAGLRLDSRTAILKGGGSGPAIVPGDPDKSLLIKSVRQVGVLKMPAGGKLKPAEVADLEAWVKMGAPWPETGSAQEEKKTLWSLRPVIKPSIPKVINTKLVQNPIDAFILAKLETAKQSLSPQADARTLLRRVTYDLTGLPPTMEQMEAFLADKTPQAYEKAVDRLLASPQYGERWARIWLDVARYADTKGYVFEEDRNYYNAYTYRDWVINAFNTDLPYDQFIVQQLAADRLPDIQNGDERHPLAALGFLTVGRRFLNSQQDIIDDRIDVTMRGFQGFTVACARCHDHKFDPIPSQDYYSLYAVFASSQEKEIPISGKAIRDPWEEYNQRVTNLENNIKSLVVGQVKKLRETVKKPEGEKTVGAAVKQTLQGIREDQVPNGDNLTKLAAAFEPASREQLDKWQKELENAKGAEPTKPEFAMAMADRPNPADGYVFKRGNPGNRGEDAPRRFLKAVSSPAAERAHWTNGSGRLELAKAIASRENPLTARVFVNRIWQAHFGNGLVRTPSDFGNQGEKPTHPELLDYLASTFMENGWSIKKLHRLIVTSATYKQSSAVSQAMFNADPENRYVGRMNRRRLDFEQMRDTFLAASGSLDLKDVGGKSVDLWTRPFSTRRTLYGFIERQNLPGIFRTFDFASPDSTSPRRFQTTVPQQALFFMNSPFSIDEALSVGNRPEITTAKDDGQRVRRLYLLLFNRLPTPIEESLGVAYLRGQSRPTDSAALNPWSYGYGMVDIGSQRTTSWTPLSTFQGGMYRIGDAFPDPALGYIMLDGVGGHPGHDGAHSVIRRWTAPITTEIEISGILNHPKTQGDGVRGLIVSSRGGLLGEWYVHNGTAETTIGSVKVQKGDTIDFVIDPTKSDNFDSFFWSPTIRSKDGTLGWSAKDNFSPPPPKPLSRLALYAQALMMTNEFIFVD